MDIYEVVERGMQVKIRNPSTGFAFLGSPVPILCDGNRILIGVMERFGRVHHLRWSETGSCIQVLDEKGMCIFFTSETMQKLSLAIDGNFPDERDDIITELERELSVIKSEISRARQAWDTLKTILDD